MEEVGKQYRDSSNLDIRIKIHEQYSTNKKDWHEWLFEHYTIEPGSRILELGSGDGTFWMKNKDRVPKDWKVTLSDFSSGMLADAQGKLGDDVNVTFKVIDIQAIPFEDDRFDAVIANHMLYHVPNRSQALKEVRRVLKPGGVFYSSTIGKQHMADFNELLKRFDPDLGFDLTNVQADAFGLENGAKQLEHFFDQVKLTCFPGGLQIDDVQAIADYILSSGTKAKAVLSGTKLEQFINYLEEVKKKNGGFIEITKATGLFESR
ncbi:class I SAM-dependent methyltransferase [Sporolactobacillus laevolacticus]|nr:class I SAM-dependent methyltransferase [Sporolactobacillus laevolacticus]